MILPAGKYYIGDPCYVIRDHDRWMKFCDEMDCDDEKIEFEGVPMYAASTAYGDGCYLDDEGHEYGVDAGLIGIVPMELIDEEMDEVKRLGRIVEFKSSFRAESDNGVFYLGNVEINTKDTY